MSLFVILHLKSRIYCRDAMEYRQLRSDRVNYGIQIICLFCMNRYNHPEASSARGDPRRWGPMSLSSTFSYVHLYVVIHRGLLNPIATGYSAFQVCRI